MRGSRWVVGASAVAMLGWGTVLPYARRRAPLAFIGALASFGSYAIALWAMTRAPVATVAPFSVTEPPVTS